MGATWTTVVPYAVGAALLVALVRSESLRAERPGLALTQRLGLLLITIPLFTILFVGVESLPNLFEDRTVAPLASGKLAAKAFLHLGLYLALPLAGLALVVGLPSLGTVVRRALVGQPGDRESLARSLAAGGLASAGLVGVLALAWVSIPAEKGGLFAAEGARVFFSNVTPMTAVLLAAAAAIAEEALFRGMLLSHLRKWQGVHVAVGIQAVFFGIIHAGYGSIEHVLAAGAFGAMMGYLTVKRGLLPAMVTHFLVNVVILGIWSGHTGLLAPVGVVLCSLLYAAWWLARMDRAAPNVDAEPRSA